MIILALVFMALLLAVILCLSSYIVRLENQFGRILARDLQQHLEAWEQLVEPRLGMSREHVTLAASVWMHLSMAIEAILVADILFLHSFTWNGDAALQWLVLMVLTVMLCGEVFPFLILQRMPGDWLASIVWLVRILLALMLPVTLVIMFLISIATLADSGIESPHEDEAGDVEALLEAGEEKGILEEEDRQLVRSALQFGDKLVKEVMTPRSAIFAVPGSMLLGDFLQSLRQHNYSRVPVYRDALDSVTGIAFAHDLLYVSDADIAQRTVGSIQRPVALVPETKRGYELLREMQREKQHMRVVLDEYGEVAGLVTIEDLLEEIVGAIRDEHEEDAEAGQGNAIPQPDGSWLLPGSYPVSQLASLLPDLSSTEIDEFQSQTVGGLVSEIADRIPLAGEVLEAGKLRLEIVQATERRIEQVRLRLVPEDTPVPSISNRSILSEISRESSHQE